MQTKFDIESSYGITKLDDIDSIYGKAITKFKKRVYQRKYSRAEYVKMILNGIENCNFSSSRNKIVSSAGYGAAVTKFWLKHAILVHNYPDKLYVNVCTLDGTPEISDVSMIPSIDCKTINIFPNLNFLSKHDVLFIVGEATHGKTCYHMEHMDKEGFSRRFNDFSFEENILVEEGIDNEFMYYHKCCPQDVEALVYAKYYKMDEWTKSISYPLFVYILFFEKLLDNKLDYDICAIISNFLMQVL